MLLDYKLNEISKEDIEAAYNAGRARLVHAWTNGGIKTRLAIDGLDIDTRGQTYSVWDAVWTTAPKSLEDCLEAAICCLESLDPQIGG
jgi:hypothetical protein